LKRFNDEINTIEFEPIDGYLQSRQEIEEPHSFDVTVNLKLLNKNLSWEYENVEGRITLSPEVIKSASIKTAVANPATIEKKLSVIGKIAPNGDALSSIYPRFAGIVKEMKKNLGDSVEKGEVIAVIESNESLRNYNIASPITGTIIQKYVIVGEMIKEDKAIYQVADLSTVWADLTLYRKEAVLIKKGMPTLVAGDNGNPQESGIINYISPLGIEDSQTILARTVLPNNNQEWIPGMYVNAAITYLYKKVPVAVELTALQHWRDWDIVFIQRGNSFEATPIKLGEKNSHWVEVISGLKPGQTYVVENSFLLKAELGKSEASHDH
jgi:membrane fusion protein, heavy metal efflux system